jgi:hypothetical protein
MQFVQLNEVCTSALQFGDTIGTSGTMKVDAYQASASIAGSFDATFGSSDAAKGTFNAQPCEVPTTLDNPTCK